MNMNTVKDVVVESANEEPKTTLLQMVEKLKAENSALKAANLGGLSLKVSQKGAVSAYGLGRFPVTLYKGQWEKLITGIEKIKVFLVDHESELSVKETKTG